MSKSNFQFLEAEWPDIFQQAKKAEKLVNTVPQASVTMARASLEKAVFWLYENDSDLELPHITTLNNLISESPFRRIVSPTILREIDIVRKFGNDGAHGKPVQQGQALHTIKYLFRFMSFLAMDYGDVIVEISPFDKALIPDGTESKATLAELKKMQDALYAKTKLEQAEREKFEAILAENLALKKEREAERKATTAQREEREKKYKVSESIPELVSEAVTRKIYIDILLKEASWVNLQMGRELEYKVTGMPKSTNSSGKGSVDYVLWGKDGKPLAVIEAKRTMEGARKGRHQAQLYADCLEQMHGQRPIIFYTNGFETFLWDDVFYADRAVQGFYTQDELQLLIDRRESRKDLRNFAVNKAIAGRYYQLEAIKRVGENLVVTDKSGKLRGSRRECLLVMATGSGKTRTATAIVDMMVKCNWAKRVLFLADRNALVTQAKNAFKEHLPELSAIDLTKEKEDKGTRLVFSTYPTIINKIDKVRTKDERFYGVGHFDLIIIDEAHRSVYQKYKAIFDYFDSMLIGLTATPKTDIDHNTYGLFGIEDNDPTFAYELNTAVKDEFLVPPVSKSVPLKFQREGIHYDDLSDAEKEEYEEKFGDPSNAEAPDIIGSAAVNKWLFNSDTVDKVLEHLMNEGIKVSGGDKLGKTIIFAKNHKHAEFIEERFNKNYPEQGSQFLRVIDNYETKAQDLLEKFTYAIKEEEPQIAVSVDMMDTGVDAPRVVNLVFFKIVRSVTKFYQMIGRGTRLCPDLFGPGDHKKEFLVLDYCQNLEFFNENPEGIKTRAPKSLMRQIFESKLKVAQLILDIAEKIESEKEIRSTYLDELNKTVADYDKERFEVKKQLRYVEKYKDRKAWQNLKPGDVKEINEHLSHLQAPLKGDDEGARRFDMLVLMYQILMLSGTGNLEKYMGKIYQIAVALQKIGENVPQIAMHLPLIKEVQTEHYWENVNVKKLDDLRKALRDLIKYLEGKSQEPVFTHFEDDLDFEGIKTHDLIVDYSNLQSYKDRVERYVRENKHHVTIKKLSTNIPITKEELKALEEILFTASVAGTKSDFEKEYGEQPLGAFIRSITGLDRVAANEAFAEFLQVGNLQADQMTFIKTIIDYLTKNGTIAREMLYDSPFTDMNDQGLGGVFTSDAVGRIFRIIDRVNENAVA